MLEETMGLSIDTVNRISSSIWNSLIEWFEGKRIEEQGLNPGDNVSSPSPESHGFPRQLGQPWRVAFAFTRGKARRPGLDHECPYGR